MRGFVVVALGAILIWIGLSTDGTKVDAGEVADVRADEVPGGTGGPPVAGGGASSTGEALPDPAPVTQAPPGGGAVGAPEEQVADPRLANTGSANTGSAAPPAPEPAPDLIDRNREGARQMQRPERPTSDSYADARRGSGATDPRASVGFDAANSGSEELARVLLEAWITEDPAELSAYMTQGQGTEMPVARQQLVGGFWEALIGKVEAAQQRFDAIRDQEGVSTTQLALLAAAIDPPGNRAVPRVASSGRIEPLALSMQMILLGDEARSLMEIRDYGRSAVAWSDLIQMELRAPWGPHRDAILQWGESLDQAQGNHRLAKGGNWPSYDITVGAGEYLTDIRKRALRQRSDLLICTGLIEATNGLVGRYHHPGDVLRIPTDRANVIVDLDARAVFYRHGDEVVQVWDCGIGKVGHETPLGTFTIGDKLERPPLSTKDLPYGHPDNPLGSRWLALLRDGQKSSYGIHGTSDPSGVGGEVSLGCIRMRNEDVNELFEILPRGAEVIIQR